MSVIQQLLHLALCKTQSLADIQLWNKNVCLQQNFFNSSVVENSATNYWLQKTVCSKVNKASHGPSSSSKDCSLSFTGSKFPPVSGKGTDESSGGQKSN